MVDSDAAWAFLNREYVAIEPENVPLTEPICDQFCRINLAQWKRRGFPLLWLFRMFELSAAVESNGAEAFAEYLQTVEALTAQSYTGFSLTQWQTYLEMYKETGMGPVHHSTQYRVQEKPAYRIVANRYARLLPILEQVVPRYRQEGRQCVIAIDGRAAAGKSTMADDLRKIIGADVIHMDDFFLPTDLRTEQRMTQPGGNVHYERFAEEVLPFISLPEGFSYRRFDCGKMDFDGKCEIGNAPIRIVEGAYSLHPSLNSYADISVFLNIDPENQMQRIFRRNGCRMAEIFRTKWIPLEEQYIAQCAVPQRADIVL